VVSAADSATDDTSPVVLFDGECNLCNGAVQFLLRRDRRARFRFASLQSDAGRALLAGTALPAPAPDSIVLVQDGRVHVRSGAALRIAVGLGLPWSLAAVCLIVPPPIRDWAYDFIARRRHRWFGRPTTCMVPGPELRGRFLDAAEPDGAAVRPGARAGSTDSGSPAR
jgi:predicted DCC family thiol-disulfide oxidoreductase YuxK